MDYKNLLYSFMCLFFSIIIGASIFEHLAVVPQWSAAPPVSLTMFQGRYGLDPGLFWQIIHPVTLLLFIATLVLYWKTGRRKTILIVLIGYVVVLIVTALYFVPELLAIIDTTFSEVPDASLTARASLWENLSLLRLVLVAILAIFLFLGLTKSEATSTEF